MAPSFAGAGSKAEVRRTVPPELERRINFSGQFRQNWREGRTSAEASDRAGKKAELQPTILLALERRRNFSGASRSHWKQGGSSADLSGLTGGEDEVFTGIPLPIGSYQLPIDLTGQDHIHCRPRDDS